MASIQLSLPFLLVAARDDRDSAGRVINQSGSALCCDHRNSPQPLEEKQQCWLDVIKVTSQL
jgi:hypothetical protein